MEQPSTSRTGEGCCYDLTVSQTRLIDGESGVQILKFTNGVYPLKWEPAARG